MENCLIRIYFPDKTSMPLLCDEETTVAELKRSIWERRKQGKFKSVQLIKHCKIAKQLSNTYGLFVSESKATSERSVPICRLFIHS